MVSGALAAVIAEFTAAVTSMPDDDAPVAACRIELRSMAEDDEDDDESSESSAETELLTVPIPFHSICG